MEENKVDSLLPAITSLLLYTMWLFILHLTTKKIDDRSYERIRVLEEIINNHIDPEPLEDNRYGVFGIHSFLLNNLSGLWWMTLRKRFWGFILGLISLSWFLTNTLKIIYPY